MNELRGNDMTETARYKAQGCGPGCPDKLDSGIAWINPAGASFQGEAAAFLLPMEGLRMDRAGATGDTIRITNPAHPDWFISTTELAIMREPMLVSRADLKSSVRSVRRKGVCCLSGCLLAIIAAIVLVVLLIASRDVLVGALANHFPPELEKRLGDKLVTTVAPPASRLDDPELVAGLDAIAAPVLAAVPDDEGFTSFTLYLSADPTPNAFALPGGHIVVNAGLIMTADNAEEVAGVIAHEAAHASLRHGLQSIISQLGTGALISLVAGDAGGLAAVMMEGGGYLMNQKYSRDFERQADEEAWQYLNTANVNPAGLVTFFEKLKAMEGGGAMPAILSTHPATADRIGALEAQLQTLPKGKAWRTFDLDYPAYKAAVTNRVGSQQ